MNNKIIKYYNDIYIKIIYYNILKEYYVYNDLKKRYNNMINEYIKNCNNLLDNFNEIIYKNLTDNNVIKKIEIMFIMPYYMSKQVTILENYKENFILNKELEKMSIKYVLKFDQIMSYTNTMEIIFEKENREIYNKIFENMLNNEELNKFNDIYILYLLRIIFTFMKDIFILEKLIEKYDNLILKSKYYDDIIYMILFSNNIKIVKIFKKNNTKIYDKFIDKYYNNIKKIKDIQHIKTILNTYINTDANIFIDISYLKKYEIIATEKKCAYYIMIDIIDLHLLSVRYNYYKYFIKNPNSIKPIFISKKIYNIMIEIESNSKSALKFTNKIKEDI